MKHLSIVLLLLLSVNISSIAQTKEMIAPEDASRLTDDIMMLVGKSKAKEAAKLINENMGKKKDAAKKMEAGLSDFLDDNAKKFGKLQGVSYAKQEEAGRFLIKFTHAVLYDKQPVWLSFSYYKTGKTYQLISVNWGDDLQQLF